MNARSVLIILAALLVAGVTAFLARGWVTAERAQIQAVQVPVVQPAPSQAVLVASDELPAGLFLKEEHLRWQAWPADGVDPNYFVQGKTELASLLGSVVRRNIAAGEPIVGGKIVKPGDRGFLAAVLKPGMRAVTIKVNEITGVAGLVFPGDRVDLLLSLALDDRIEDTPDRRASETVLENVRVLAIGRTLAEGGESPPGGEMATIEVTPKQAEMVAVMVELGRISLSLRSLASPELNEFRGALVGGAAPAGETALGAAPYGVPGATLISDSEAPDAAAVPRDPRQAEEEENPSPVRGLTYTFDSEVSQLLAAPSSTTTVTVQHGSTSETIQFD